jgi:hypothetical protein
MQRCWLESWLPPSRRFAPPTRTPNRCNRRLRRLLRPSTSSSLCPMLRAFGRRARPIATSTVLSGTSALDSPCFSRRRTWCGHSDHHITSAARHDGLSVPSGPAAEVLGRWRSDRQKAERLITAFPHSKEVARDPGAAVRRCCSSLLFFEALLLRYAGSPLTSKDERWPHGHAAHAARS